MTTAWTTVGARSAIARARVALRGIEAELRSAGEVKCDARRITAALAELNALEEELGVVTAAVI